MRCMNVVCERSAFLSRGRQHVARALLGVLVLLFGFAYSRADGPAPSDLPVDYSLHGISEDYTPPEPDSEGYYYWKGNLHTHSLWSDGDQFPEVVTAWYKRHGYHFLALSEHNLLPRGEKWINPRTNRYARRGGGMDVYELYRKRFGDDWVETREVNGELEVRLKPLQEFRPLFEEPGRFLMLESEEITINEPGNRVHVNVTNIAELILPQVRETIPATIEDTINTVLEQRERTGQPMIPHLDHPNWRDGIPVEDMVEVENLRFFEVYNGSRTAQNLGDGRTIKDLDRMWDIMLARRLGELNLGILYGLAADDAHDYEASARHIVRPGRGWIRVRSRFLTPERLIGAIEAGDFYASNGVTMRRIRSDGGQLSVEVEPEEGVTYTIEFIGTRRGYDTTREAVLNGTDRYSDEIGVVLETVEGAKATYTFQGDELYVRAKITSSKPKENWATEGEMEMAWIQPVIPDAAAPDSPPTPPANQN